MSYMDRLKAPGMLQSPLITGTTRKDTTSHMYNQLAGRQPSASEQTYWNGSEPYVSDAIQAPVVNPLSANYGTRVGTSLTGATFQTPTIAQQTAGAAYGTTGYQTRKMPTAEPVLSREEAYRAQRAAEVAQKEAPKLAYNAWINEMESQPWYKEWREIMGSRQSTKDVDGWGYNIRTGKWSNTKDALIERFGTADPIEFAVMQGMRPPPGVESGTGWDYTKQWAPNPVYSQTSLLPQPKTSAFNQNIENRRAEIQQRNANSTLKDTAINQSTAVGPTASGMMSPQAPNNFIAPDGLPGVPDSSAWRAQY